MASPVKAKEPKSVLHDIFAWSIGRPAWWRDALRRIITKENLDDSDRAELENLCRQTLGAVGADGKPLIAIPLAEEHLPAGPNAQASISIEYLDNLTGVNRLPTGQKVAFGASPGLTIVYGDNGTGKSGYVRVIKKACKTRGAPPVIRPDAFAPASPKPACKIGIKAPSGSSEVVWTDGTLSDERLGNVFVFDAHAASHYLMADGPASFTPYGLDVLPKLTKICDFIALRIKKDVTDLEATITVQKTALDKHPTTDVGKALAKIDADTSLAYPKEPFPKIESDARCVLCQRPFNGDAPAISHARSFEKFCNDDVQKAAKAQREKLTEKKTLFNGKTALKPEYDKITTDLSTLTAIELKLLTDFIGAADDCLATIQKSFDADKWTV